MKAQYNLKINASESMPTKETAQGGRMQEDVQYFETVIIGSGLLAAIRLQKKRCNDFILLERSSELGGTWQVNSYPGAEVDIPTSLYSISFIAFRRYPGTSTISQLMKSYYRSRLKKHLKKHIKDDKLRQHMIPNYELGCRRVIPSNTYLPALSRDNVDVDISGIECITAQGIKTKDGKEIPLDIIVYATGYFAYSNMKKALTFQVYGLGGRNLNSEWENEAVSYKGITVSGYPNYFKVNGPNTGNEHSSQISYMQVATDYIVQAISAVKRDKSIRAIDAKQDLQDTYVAERREKMKKTVWQNATCTAFYRKNMSEGHQPLPGISYRVYLFTQMV